MKCTKVHFIMADNFSLDVPERNSNFAKFFNDPCDWTYRCEGSWTMVLALSKMRTVLRLRKKECNKLPTLKEEEDYLREMLHNRGFAKHVISPLMGDSYVHVGDVISVPQGFASAMNEISRVQRPEYRLDKEIDESCSFGVIMPDFCFVPLSSPGEGNTRATNETGNPTFSVEIKPKCGFLPTSPYMDSSRSIKYSVCYYCMLQKSKVKVGKYKRRSKYCPLDLFSSEPSRVMYALECLVSDPQNNLRVFCNGRGIFTEELVQEAIQAGKICCSEKYFEMTLKEMDGFRGCVKAGHKCGCGVTVEGHKCEDGVTTECHKHGDGVNIEGREFGVDVTTEDHECGHVGPLAKQFLGILLEILISDSNRSKIKPNQVTRKSSPTTQICKESKYPRSNITIQRHLNHLQFGTGGVLWQLLSVQKLDYMDVEGIYPLYQKVISHFECNPGVRDSLGVDGPYTSPLWKAVASSFVSSSPEISNSAVDMTSRTSSSVAVLNPDLTDQNALYDVVLKICKFAVAHTAKDCSVMIAFQKTSNSDDTIHVPTVQTTNGNTLCYNIDFVDLDPKEFDRVLKYYNDSKYAVENYLD